MNGLALIASVPIQVVVASRKAPARSGPSGKRFHASVANAANASSLSMPAAPMRKRLARLGTFQASVVSV